jgi:glyceraldehyde-3-phosphate dehydrogenase/erythrose-4-phosphate dehydrogenase
MSGGARWSTVAINGLGRIGRAAFKIFLETLELELRAIREKLAMD